MQHSYILEFHKWKRLLVIVFLAFFTAVIIWFGQGGSFSVFTSKESAALTKGNSNETDIALTFNISWGEEKVYDILEQLDANQVQATFFISGEWAERHPDILKEITEGEHEIGMLGYRYKSYLEQDIEQVRKDLIYAKEVFGKLGYKEIDLLRAPSGHLNKEIITLAETLDFKVIHWSVNPNDWENPGTQVIIDSIMKETKNGDILLLHASDAVKQTANALETIIPGLKGKGFEFVSISELNNQAHAKSKLAD